MSVDRCRVCGHQFFETPLLQYKNMPAAAQYMPDANSVMDEKGVNLDVLQCAGCGLVQLGNDPVSYYREVIRAAAFSQEMKEFRIKQFNKFVNDYSLSEKKIIEIGCGCGEYLSLMKQCGADVYGLEYSRDFVAQYAAQGLNVSHGFIESSVEMLDNAPFDAFFILNFFEHLPDPNAALKGVYKNLSDDAIGLVEVPNFDMIIRNKLFSEFIGDHLFYFTKETLSMVLERNGFEILECNEIWHDYIISVVVKKKGELSNVCAAAQKVKRLDIADFYCSQEKLRVEINEYIDRFGENRVAIWGAGHQALAMMSLANLDQKIKYVVDSAPFKQGKFTPATHIPIVSPDLLNIDSVDAVIVMAASYSDEVARIIREKYNRNIDVVILRDFGLESFTSNAN